MRIALISDMHGMDVAFAAVIEDMQRQSRYLDGTRWRGSTRWMT